MKMKQLLLTCSALLFCAGVFSQSAVTLKFNLDKGKTYKMQAINNQNVVSTYNGNSYTTEVKSVNSISYKMLSRDNDMMNIEFRFDTIQTKSTSPMGSRETNSAIPAKKSEYLEQLMNRFSSNSIIAQISTSGKFAGFVNYKTFRDNVLLGLDSMPDNKKEQIRKQIEMVVAESALQTMIEPLFAYMPDKPVKAGDKWETSYSVSGGGMSGMIFNTITLEKADGNSAELNVTSELESIPASGDVNMSFDIKGNSTGTMTVDTKTGLIIKSTDKKSYSGSMTVKNQGNVMNIPMSIDAQAEIVKQ